MRYGVRGEVGRQRAAGAVVAGLAMLVLCGCGGDKPDGAAAAVPAERAARQRPARTDDPSPALTKPARQGSQAAAGRNLDEVAPRSNPVQSTATAVAQHGEAFGSAPVQPVFRPPDTRPRHDDTWLDSLGIRAYESRHLKLYTDIEPEIARTLPPFVDAAYPEWAAYFGPLPPDREGLPFQMTAYVMRDQALFREAGLLPEDLRSFSHGRHRGAEFWMNDQEHAYYRRHLVIHEATHCFMTILQEPPNWPAPWYMEGMAEHFGTHRRLEEQAGELDDPSGASSPVKPQKRGVAFRLMPDRPENFAGHGRITLIQNATRTGRAKTLDQVLRLRGNDYLDNDSYAWSWALCLWLDKHPRYQQRFRELGQHLSRRALSRALQRLFGDDLDDLRAEWTVFTHSLQYGYQTEQAAMELRAGEPLSEGAEGSVSVLAGRGWQSSGIHLHEGSAYELSASGRFTLANDPKPWISEPQGISFRYFGGRPLGQLLGAIHSDSDTHGQSLLEVFPVGRHLRFVPASSGTLYLRLNDSWSELDDNTGAAQVRVQASPADSN